MKALIVRTLEAACGPVDRLPNWTYPFVGTWLGCPGGLALWSSRLDERWGTGVWHPTEEATR